MLSLQEIILHKQKNLGNIYVHNEHIKKKKSWSCNKPLYG